MIRILLHHARFSVCLAITISVHCGTYLISQGHRMTDARCRGTQQRTYNISFQKEQFTCTFALGTMKELRDKDFITFCYVIRFIGMSYRYIMS